METKGKKVQSTEVSNGSSVTVFCSFVWVWILGVPTHLGKISCANVRCSKDYRPLVRNAKALNTKGRILENNKPKKVSRITFAS